MKQIEINANESGQRFDKYLKKLLREASGSFIYKMLRKKNITLNGKKADGSEKLQTGDEVKLFLSDETYAKFTGADETPGWIREIRQIQMVPLDVVYEDADVLVINKPCGMLSQKADGKDVSANEYILRYLLDQKCMTEEELRTFRPSICNRLDRNTSGLLIAGKTLKGLQMMSEALKERSMQKYYRCLVAGRIQGRKKICGYLRKEEKTNQVEIFSKEQADTKYIETAYEPIAYYGDTTLLEVHLITGRSHQIRAHLASIGHPILGDTKYGDPGRNRRLQKETGIRSQLLHAYRMEDKDGKVMLAPEPQTFQKAIAYYKSKDE